MRLVRPVLCGAFILVSVASAAARPGVALATVNLRAEANTSSAVVTKIPAGSRIEVGECTAGWCAVTFGDRSGFSIETSLDTSGKPRRVAAARRPPPGAVPYDDDFIPAPGYIAPGYVAPGPRVYYYGPGPYWGPYWGPRWGWGRRHWW